MFFGLNDVAFLAAVSAPAVPTDPFFANVSLLLHGDGTNGSTTITDSSPSPKTVTAFGDAQISTAQSKFGGASIAFDGSGDYLQTSTSSGFTMGTGDFTYELWLYPSNTDAGYRRIIIDNTYSSGQSGYGLFRNGSALEFWKRTPNTRIVDAPGALTAGVWQHVAITRSGNSFRGFVNGIQVGATSTDSSESNATFLGIGRDTAAGTGDYNGYIDDLRITKGVARYTTNFTPPTAPFPDA
jgi:hypothetical protein